MTGFAALAALIMASRSASAEFTSGAPDDDVSDAPAIPNPTLHARVGVRSTIEHAVVPEGAIGHEGPLLHAPFTLEGELGFGSHLSLSVTFAYAPSLTMSCTGNPYIKEGCGLPFFRGSLELAGRWQAAPGAEAWVGGGIQILSARARAFWAEGDSRAEGAPPDWSPGGGLGASGGLDFRRGAARFGPLITAAIAVPVGVSLGVGWRVSVGS